MLKPVKTIPETQELREKKGSSLKLSRKIVTWSAFACSIAAVLLLIGTLVTVLMGELGSFAEQTVKLLYLLAAIFGGASVVLAIAGFLCGKFSQDMMTRELDYLERCDSENSFYIGEGTLATFGGGVLCIHGGINREIRIPYRDLRFFSVCSRRAPREKGEWSVVIEIPSHYLTKDESGRKDEKPALVQTDYKERLVDCLNREGLELVGEKPQPKENGQKDYTKLKEFSIPEHSRRKRALGLIVLGAVFLVAMIPVIFWQTTVAVILGVFGAFLLGRGVVAFVGAKGRFVFFREGIWWRDPNRFNSVFLKWEEIEEIKTETRDQSRYFNVGCAYGSYYLPQPDGAAEYLKSLFSEIEMQDSGITKFPRV